MSEIVASYDQICDSDKEFPVSYIPSLGSIVKNGRTKHHLTQVELGELTNSNGADISRIEKSITKKPSREFLKAVSPYTGYSYTELLPIAGYSLTDEKKVYFNTGQQEIDYLGAVKDIYAADADLLDCFKGINEFADEEDITILKLLLKLMKQTSNGGKGCAGKKHELFSKTKLFFSAYLEALAEA